MASNEIERVNRMARRLRELAEPVKYPPASWTTGGTYRCAGDHVSAGCTKLMNCVREGGGEAAMWTFPEDADGPLGVQR